jgi:hypothetical protein
MPKLLSGYFRNQCPDAAVTLSGCFRNGCPDKAEIRTKSACQKENSVRCRYTVEEMLKITECLKLTGEEFDEIFFDGKLTECINDGRKNNIL